MTTLDFPDTYDSIIQEHCPPYLDWRWLKAMVAAESNFNPKAVSSCGARGLLQLMPTTFYNEPGAKWKNDTDGFDPTENIKAGIKEFLRNWHCFGQEKGLERLKFASAGYNCGRRHLIKAQELARQEHIPDNRWEALTVTLPFKITIPNAYSVVVYINNILKAFHYLKKEAPL